MSLFTKTKHDGATRKVEGLTDDELKKYGWVSTNITIFDEIKHRNNVRDVMNDINELKKKLYDLGYNAFSIYSENENLNVNFKIKS